MTVTVGYSRNEFATNVRSELSAPAINRADRAKPKAHESLYETQRFITPQMCAAERPDTTGSREATGIIGRSVSAVDTQWWPRAIFAAVVISAPRRGDERS